MTTATSNPLVEVAGLSKRFVRRRNLLGRPVESVYALQDIDLQVRDGETLGIVGESGSGKSTLGRVILALESADAGTIRFAGEELRALRRRELKSRRREMQMIFQDPYSSLDPTKTVGTSILEPIVVHEGRRVAARSRDRVAELLEMVGLHPDFADRYPAEMSGGQRQRIAIARALALNPKLIVADEAVSALDASTQSEVINLMIRLQRELRLTYVFISHNLAVVRHISDRIAVMYLGRIVELGTRDQIYDDPQHPYTAALLAAVPQVRDEPAGGWDDIVLEGDPPDPTNPPPGCAFASRCPKVIASCTQVRPPLVPVGGTDRLAACHLLS
jgi:oligopeptide/dipeptide ABC transporter ATP-binding protein